MTNLQGRDPQWSQSPTTPQGISPARCRPSTIVMEVEYTQSTITTDQQPPLSHLSEINQELAVLTILPVEGSHLTAVLDSSPHILHSIQVLFHRARRCLAVEDLMEDCFLLGLTQLACLQHTVKQVHFTCTCMNMCFMCAFSVF